MIITKTWAMPNSATYTIKPIKQLIERYITPYVGLWIDPFSKAECGEAAIKFVDKPKAA